MLYMDESMRLTPRAYLSKFPFKVFSSYPGIQRFSTFITSYDDFMGICDANIWSINDSWREAWLEFAKGYDWTDGVPKGYVHVHLNPDISDFDREFVTNGIRGYLDQRDILLSRYEMSESIKSLNTLFTMIVAVIGVTALFIMFFLLLVAMTKNIHEAVWEYGVLRSMGLTESEGRRLYLYEAYTVVATSTLLGLIVGIIACYLVSIQLFTFAELPSILMFPTWTFLAMVLILSLTTYFAVHYPITQVNRK